ncbi:MAG TPA: TonB family protein [Opitutaceae bacterium]|jgi:RNA polymerase sigma factor (sigma-70 family)|nr:TonB family protein [Opitutaceae bacterium]
MASEPMDDAALLQSYARNRSEAAFAEFVRRHVDLVYSAALRQVGGDPHRAQEVTQVVFTGLARKAAALARHPAPLAWLFQSTRFAAANLRREEGRRRLREGAAALEWTAEAAPAADWDRLRPVLDDALSELREGEREAVLLRYFSNEPFAEVGRRLGLNENAARMRVERAVAKLQGQLTRRGITSTAAALGAVLAGNAVAAAPLGVAAAATGAALAGTAGAGGLAGLALLMSSTKFQLGAFAAVMMAGAATAVLQQQGNVRTRMEIARTLQQEDATDYSAAEIRIAALRCDSLRLSRAATEARDLRQAASAAAAASSKISGADAPAAPVRPNVLHGGGGRVYQLNELDQQPMPVAQAAPHYPDAAKVSGSSGQAMIEFTIGANGSTADVHAVNSSDPSFADAATAAVQQWRFQPGRKGGQPVGVLTQVPMVFSIKNDDGGSPDWF